MRRSLRISILFVILSAYSAFLLYLGLQNKIVDYTERMFYKIVQDTYFVGCAENSKDLEKCHKASGRYVDHFRKVLEQIE